MKKNKIIVFLLLIFSIELAFAKPKLITEPKGNEVILIGRISFTTDVDREFFFNTMEIPEDKRNYKDVYIMPYFSDKFTYTEEKLIHAYSDSKKSIQKFEEQAWAVNGDYFFTKYSYNRKAKAIYLDSVTMFLGASYKLAVELPLNMKITVPDGEKFLYIGDYTFNAKGFAFSLSGVVEDKFDEAQIALNGVSKEEYTLCRVTPELLTKKQMKNVHATYEAVGTKFSKWYDKFKDLPVIKEE